MVCKQSIPVAVLTFVLALTWTVPVDAGTPNSRSKSKTSGSTVEPAPTDSGTGTSPTAGTTTDSWTTGQDSYELYDEWYYWELMYYGGDPFDPNYYYFGY